MQLKVLAVVTLVATAFADEQTLATLHQLRDITSTFEQDMALWDGTYTNGLSIVKSLYDLYSTLGSAAYPLVKYDTVTADSPDDIEYQAFGVAQDLVNDIAMAVDTAISMKPRIDAISSIMGPPATRMVFQKLRDTASTLGNVLGSTASSESSGNATDIIQQIDNHFARGIAAYQ
ncbi:hypothetical protein BX600DRAFT_507351 [Xylariales sp. PMI_506]|nr:hypothetical protein BX600DRAFT_507351 [Xylariales sp. PMI_506]